MKLSNNFIGALIFTVLAIIVFVLMAMRPVVEGDAMIFGMPVKVESAPEAAVIPPATEIKTEEVIEPVKTEEPDATITPAPAVEAPVMNSPATTESMPTEAPQVESVVEPTSVMPETPSEPVTPAN